MGRPPPGVHIGLANSSNELAKAQGPSSLFELRGRSLCCDRACPAKAGEACGGWWSQAGSNRRPLACHASALPAELWPLHPFRKQRASPFRIKLTRAPLPRRASRTDPDHRSGSISSLLVVANVADDVGDILIALFLVRDEGGVVIVVAFDGFVDLNILFRLGNNRLHLAGLLLGIGLLERHQLLGLRRLWHGLGGWRGRARRLAAGTWRRHRSDRHDLARVRRNHRILVQIVKFLARCRANALGSEIGFGHVRNPENV